jgi:hypothetical protein
MRTNDFSLRPENLHTLSLAGLTSPTSQLLTLSSLSFMTIFPSHNFALVDHNRLGVSYVHTPGAQVTALIDHHKDEGLYLSASPRIVSRAAAALPTSLSCSRLHPPSRPNLPPSSSPPFSSTYPASNPAAKPRLPTSEPLCSLAPDRPTPRHCLKGCSTISEATTPWTRTGRRRGGRFTRQMHSRI